MLEVVSTVRLPVEEGADIENTVIVEYDGDAHLIYDGYIYENEELQSIIDIYGNYYVD